MEKQLVPDLLQTLGFMCEAHAKQTDKNRQPYWHHPMRVMRRLADSQVSDDAKKAALLHDVIEDTSYSLLDLLNMGHAQDTLDMVELLTKRPGQTHAEYKARLLNSGNFEAVAIKLADLYDNTAPDRLAWLQERPWLLERYNLFIKDIKSLLPEPMWSRVRSGVIDAERFSDED